MPEINASFHFLDAKQRIGILRTKLISVRRTPEKPSKVAFRMDKSLLYFCSILVEAFSIACCKIEFLKQKTDDD
jgi:hypothetical protein